MAVELFSDTRMEIREGGGCLSIFGLPFLGAGLFVLFAAAGLIPCFTEPDMNLWARLGLAFGGLVFAVAGGLFVFGRSRIVIDKAQGAILRNRSLLSVLIQSRSFPINTFQSVELGFDAGDSDSPDTYPVVLKNADTACDLRISSNANYAVSLEEARQLAIFLNLPLEDATTDHKAILAPGEVDKPLAQRLHESDEDVWAAQPVTMQSKVEMTSGRLQIRVPRRGFRVIMLLPLVVVLSVLYYVLPDLMDFFQHSGTPEPVQWILTGIILLVFGLIPLMSAVRAALGKRGYTEILIADGHIQITEQRAWRQKAISIEAADMTGLDYGTVKSRSEQAAMEFRTRAMKSSADNTVRPMRPLPSWAAALASLARSKGITIKHRRGLYTFGAGLPDEEVKYLYSLIRRSLG